jgi:hypothetical protein
MQNNKQKVFNLPKDFYAGEKGSSDEKKFLTYKEISFLTIFSMPPEMMIREMAIIQKRDKLQMIITPNGIITTESEMRKLTSMIVKSVQCN